MGRVVYSLTVSLDGFVETRERGLDWTAPEADLLRFLTDQTRAMGMLLHGRRMYELMAAAWTTPEMAASPVPVMAEFADIWKNKPKVVFSRTLEKVGWNSRLVRDDVVGEVARLKREVEGDIGVGGATLASALMKLGLIDEYQLVLRPIVLGGGTPFFPPLDAPRPLYLSDTRHFDGGVVLLRYAHAASSAGPS
jgi:dihydrofolate reductase